MFKDVYIICILFSLSDFSVVQLFMLHSLTLASAVFTVLGALEYRLHTASLLLVHWFRASYSFVFLFLLRLV